LRSRSARHDVLGGKRMELVLKGRRNARVRVLISRKQRRGRGNMEKPLPEKLGVGENTDHAPGGGK